MEELVTFISQVGFPIGVATYSLVKLETTILGNTKAIQTMSEAISLTNQSMIAMQTEIKELKGEN